jgi:hypothetical protein
MAAGSEDFYALLGIDASANAALVREVWRKLARQWHPDHAGSETTAMFQKISAAYAVLSDPVARAAYDRRHSTPNGAPGKRPADTSYEPATTRRRAPAVMISRVCGSLNALLACGIAKRVDRELIELFLNAKEAAQGGMVAISMWVHIRKAHTIVDELFSAWLAVSPMIVDGTILSPSELLPGMVHPLRFRIRVQTRKPESNQAPEPTSQTVTGRAAAYSAPVPPVAHR